MSRMNLNDTTAGKSDKKGQNTIYGHSYVLPTSPYSKSRYTELGKSYADNQRKNFTQKAVKAVFNEHWALFFLDSRPVCVPASEY
jgi:hypothetical protein